MAATPKIKELKTARIPLIGQIFSRELQTDPVSKDQIFVNTVPVIYKNPVTNKETYRLKKRQGFTSANGNSSSNITSATFKGHSNVGDSIYTVSNSSGSTTDLRILKWVAGSGPSTTSDAFAGAAGANTVTYVSRPVGGGISGATFGVAFIVQDSLGNNTGWYWNTSGTTVTQLTDAEFPDGTSSGGARGNFVYLNGYWFILKHDGTVWNSDLNDITSWASTSFIGNASEGEIGVSLAAYQDKIVSFSSDGLKFYELANPAPSVGSPLQEIQHLRSNMGAAGGVGGGIDIARTGYRLLEAFDSVYWIGGAGEGTSGNSIYYLENHRPKLLTSINEESVFRAEDQLQSIIASGYAYTEPALFCLVGTSIWVYFLKSKLWSKWIVGSGISLPASPRGYTVPIGYVGAGYDQLSIFAGTKSHIAHSYESLANAVWQDEGTNYTFSAQTSKIDFDTENRKRLHKCKLLGNKQSSTTLVSISWSDDDYNTFNTIRTVDMTNDRAYLSNGGAFRRRAFKLEYTGSNPLDLEAIEINYSELNS